MWFSILTFILLLQGTMGNFLSSYGFKKCVALLPVERLEDPEFLPPNEEELKALCPTIMEFIECSEKQVFECTGSTLLQLTTSSDQNILRKAKVAVNVGNIIIDLCNEETTIHKGYVESISCVKDMIETNNYAPCYAEANGAYSVYANFLLYNPQVRHLRGKEGKHCIIGAYVKGCEMATLMETCGKEAFETWIEILGSFKGELKFTYCSDEDLLALKTTFLDVLDIDDEQKVVLHLTFDLEGK